MKEETSRIEIEENQRVNYRKPIMIGAGILVAYFTLFGITNLSVWYHSSLYMMIFEFGEFATGYMWSIMIVPSIISLNLISVGLYFFISGIRRMRKLEMKTEDIGMKFFMITYLISMITTSLLTLFQTTFNVISIYYENLPSSPWLSIFFTLHYFGLVMFGLVMIVIIIQNYFLKKSGLIDLMIVKRPIVHFFLLGSLIIWLFFLLNHYIVITPLFDYFHLPFISSQIITSFLAAGVYLELVIKIRKTNKANKIKEGSNEFDF